MEPQTPHGFSNLGGNERPFDERDLKLGAAVSPTYTFPPISKDSGAWSAPIEYQNGQPACGAHAGASIKGIRDGRRYTPRFTWANIKTFDGFPIDAGTDMRSIFKSLTKTGALPFLAMGNEVGLSLSDYAHPALTQEMINLATQNKGGGYGFATDTSFNGLKQFIDDHGPCILLIQVGSEFWTAPNGQPSWAEKDILPLRYPPSIISGHFIVAHDYDVDNIYFLNSFGPTWGRNGHGYFQANYIGRVLEAGTFFPLAYTKDLYQTMTDPDVKRLQKQLNKNPKTQVAPSGAGSPGQETEFFGALTFAAVKKYQVLNNIPVTGYCGPLTRASLTKL